jgi:hypothetical protein
MAANTREERIEFTAVDKMSAVVSQINQNIGVLKSRYDTLKNALAAVGVTVGAGAMLKLYSDTLKANAALRRPQARDRRERREPRAHAVDRARRRP